MQRMQKSMTIYVKSLSKRTDLEEREKALPIAFLGQTMTNHGEEFEPDSEFGNCLISKFTSQKLCQSIGHELTSVSLWKKPGENCEDARDLYRGCYSRMVGILGAILGHDEGIPGINPSILPTHAEANNSDCSQKARATTTCVRCLPVEDAEG